MASLTTPKYMAPLGGLYRICIGTYALLTSVTDLATDLTTLIFVAAFPKTATQAAGAAAYTTADYSTGATIALYGWDDAGAANTVSTTVQVIVIGY